MLEGKWIPSFITEKLSSYGNHFCVVYIDWGKKNVLWMVSHWAGRRFGFIHPGCSPRNRWLTQKTLKSKAFGYKPILSCRPCWHPRAWWGGSLDKQRKTCRLLQCGRAVSSRIYLSPSCNAMGLTERAGKTLPRVAQHLCMCVR